MKTVQALVLIASAGAQVPFERIKNARSEPGNWLTYSGNFEAQRFSPLTQLTPANDAGLKTKWIYQAQNPGTIETTPLVFDNVMYITEPQTIVTALDLRTGRKLWTWERVLPQDLNPIGFGRVDRGVAALGDTL